MKIAKTAIFVSSYVLQQWHTLKVLAVIFFDSMLIKHNLLRMYRRQSNLAQADIARVLGVPNNSRISRWEKGHRHPPLKVLIGYTLLFNASVETLFERHKEELTSAMANRALQHLQKLQDMEQDHKTKKRVDFLQVLLNRLNAKTQ